MFRKSSFKSEWEEKITTSSANIIILQIGRNTGKSLINRTNRIGPKTEP
jgi:hypothetical protein